VAECRAKSKYWCHQSLVSARFFHPVKRRTIEEGCRDHVAVLEFSPMPEQIGWSRVA
jgi:hypothetical protein